MTEKQSGPSAKIIAVLLGILFTLGCDPPPSSVGQISKKDNKFSIITVDRSSNGQLGVVYPTYCLIGASEFDLYQLGDTIDTKTLRCHIDKRRLLDE